MNRVRHEHTHRHTCECAATAVLFKTQFPIACTCKLLLLFLFLFSVGVSIIIKFSINLKEAFYFWFLLWKKKDEYILTVVLQPYIERTKVCKANTLNFQLATQASIDDWLNDDRQYLPSVEIRGLNSNSPIVANILGHRSWTQFLFELFFPSIFDFFELCSFHLFKFSIKIEVLSIFYLPKSVKCLEQWKSPFFCVC